VTLVSVSVVGLLFGAFAVVLAIPWAAAAATLIDILVRPRSATSTPTPPARPCFVSPRPARGPRAGEAYACAGCWTSRTRNASTMSLTPRMMAQAATQATSSTALRP
jgi:hypothetical protein